MSQQDVINAVNTMKAQVTALFNAVNVPMSTLMVYATQAAASAAAAAQSAAGNGNGGTPSPPPAPSPSTPSGVLSRISTAMASAPANYAAIQTVAATITHGTTDDGYENPVPPGASGFKRHWFANGPNGGGSGGFADLLTATKVATIGSLGPAFGGAMYATSNSGSSKTQVYVNGGAFPGSSGDISDMAIGFTHTGRSLGFSSNYPEAVATLVVDGKRLATPLTWLQDAPYTFVDFGTSATRNIVFKGRAGLFMAEMVTGANDTIVPYDWTNNGAKPLYSYMGDSWGQTNEGIRGFSLPQLIGELMGAGHIVGSSIGGTGYLQSTNPTDYPPATGQYRRQAFAVGTPDIMHCTMFVNDNLNNPSAFSAAVATTLGNARTDCPNALLVVSTWGSSGGRATSEADRVAAVKAQVQLIAGPWVFIDGHAGTWLTSTGTTRSTALGPMITGEGSVLEPSGTGNADTWIDEPNGRHPTPVGVVGIANWMSARMKEAIASMNVTVVTPASISPASATVNMTVGTAVNQLLGTISDGTPTSVTSGSAPAGTSFVISGQTLRLQGTPTTAAASSTANVVVATSGGSVTFALTRVVAAVSAPPPAPSGTIALAKAAAQGAPANVAAITRFAPTITYMPEGELPVLPGETDYVRHWINAPEGSQGAADLFTKTNAFNHENWSPIFGGNIYFVDNAGQSKTEYWYPAPDGSRADNPLMFGFTYDGRSLSLPANPNPYKTATVWVEGQGVSQEIRWEKNGTKSNEAVVDFGTAAVRNIVVTYYGDVWFPHFCTGAGRSVTPYNWQGNRVVGAFIGDSIVGDWADTAIGLSFTELQAKLIGVHAFVTANGSGSGYTTAADDNPITGDNRLSQLALASPKVIHVTGGWFDRNGNLADFVTAVNLAYSKLRTANPNALLVVQAPWVWNENIGAIPQITDRIAAMKTALAGTSGPWIFLDNVTGSWLTSAGTSRPSVRGPWQTGAGNMQAPTGTGNGDTWNLADGPGLTAVGQIGMANIWAEEYKAALASMS